MQKEHLQDTGARKALPTDKNRFPAVPSSSSPTWLRGRGRQRRQSIWRAGGRP